MDPEMKRRIALEMFFMDVLFHMVLADFARAVTHFAGLQTRARQRRGDDGGGGDLEDLMAGGAGCFGLRSFWCALRSPGV